MALISVFPELQSKLSLYAFCKQRAKQFATF